MASSAPPLRIGTKAAFGLGQIGEGVQAAVFLFFLLFYYNQVLGVPGTLCGLALALSLVFDAVTDPLVGNLSDAWRSKLGRRHPFMYAAALPLGLGFFLLFNPLVSGDWPLFGWLLTMTILCRGAMTLYHVPHSALGAELSQDYNERTVLVALRHTFGAVSFILVFYLGFFVYFAASEAYPNGKLNPEAYGPFSGWLAVAMAVSVWYSAFGTRSRVPYLPVASPSQTFTLRGMVSESLLAMRNPSFRWMIIGFVVIIIAFGAAGTLNMYMLTFFWAFDPTGVFIVLSIGPLGSIVGYACARPFYTAFTKRQGVLAGTAIWLFSHGISVPLLLSGVLPAPGTGGLLAAVSFFAALGAFGIAQLLVGVGTMLADIADEHELAYQRRQEGIFFGAFSFTNKSSAALGSLIGGTVLDLIGWPTGAAVRGAADVPWDTLVSLGLIWGPLSAVLALPGLYFISRYALTRERHSEILRELEERRSAEPAPAWERPPGRDPAAHGYRGPEAVRSQGERQAEHGSAAPTVE
jgi:Na+/melibiose symporter-like transporter